MTVPKFIKIFRPEVYLLTGMALLTRLWHLFSPAQVVFDEVYFKQFAAYYFSGSYSFDIHPPLGKLLLAGWGWLLGLNANVLQNSPAVGLRILPAVAGALIIPVFYAILRRLHLSRQIAFLGALFLLFDNALLVESRFILIDSMLILFALLGLYFFVRGREATSPSKYWYLLGAGIFIGLSVSVKWTGLATFGLIGLISFYDLVQAAKQRFIQTKLNNFFIQASILILIPCLVYLLTFWIHFALLTKSGPGDAFMSVPFQSTLTGSRSYDPSVHLSFTAKFIELNRAMYNGSATLTATHPYGSRWYNWPLMTRGVYYWTGEVANNINPGYIYLLGNPAVWWLSLAGLVTSLAFVFFMRQRAKLKTTGLALCIFWTSYILNLAPFIPVTRVMFLYHYLFALIASVAVTAVTLGIIFKWNHGSEERFWRFPSMGSRAVYVGLVAVIILSFIFFAPLSYGTPLSMEQLQSRMWLNTWR